MTVMICCIVTFQATYIGLYNRFEKKYLGEAVNTINTGTSTSSGTSSGDTTAETTSDFMKKATAKLAEVDSIYRNYYIDELDDDALIDGMLTGGNGRQIRRVLQFRGF